LQNGFKVRSSEFGVLSSHYEITTPNLQYGDSFIIAQYFIMTPISYLSSGRRIRQDRGGRVSDKDWA
jgi:hypothetical protein